jgi:hypothetical protein
MPQAIDISPAIPPGNISMEQYGQIEVDIFCTHCFYNLHGQVVTIDPHLKFPVCRCPECGTFHPAGAGITSSSIWLRRLTSVLLFTWVGIVLLSAIAFTAVLAVLSNASIQAFAWGMPYLVAPHVWQYRMHLNNWRSATNYDTNVNGFSVMMFISGGSLMTAFIAGVLFVTLLWHWQRARYAWALLLPILPAIILVIFYDSLPYYENIRSVCTLHVLVQTGIQCAGVVAGILLGRKISRMIILAIIPPKPRQSLAFLWLVDNKKPPSPG